MRINRKGSTAGVKRASLSVYLLVVEGFPGPQSGESRALVTDRRMPVKVLRWMNPVRKVRKRRVPKRGPIMGRPQMQLLMPFTMLLTNSITIPRFSDAAVFGEGYGFGVNNIN